MNFHFYPFLSSHFPAPGHANTWLVTKHLLLVMLSRHILLDEGEISGCCISKPHEVQKLPRVQFAEYNSIVRPGSG